MQISFIALLVTSILQLAVVVATGSVALLADTIHNFSDALTAIPLFLAFRLSRRTPTRRSTYGYGRAEDLAGIFVVAMISLSAIVAGWEAVARLIHPRTIHGVWILFAAGTNGFIGNELVAMFRIREGNAIGSAALVADGHHARTDRFTSLAAPSERSAWPQGSSRPIQSSGSSSPSPSSPCCEVPPDRSTNALWTPSTPPSSPASSGRRGSFRASTTLKGSGFDGWGTAWPLT